MNLKNYLDFYAVLNSDNSTREERRSFGLSSVELKDKPQEQLIKWTDKYIGKLKKPLISDRVNSYLYGVTLTFTIIAFMLGVFSGITLLNYNGSEPVNVVYFMAMVILLPLVTIFLTIFSMYKVNSSTAMLIHLSPAFWMEKVFALLPNKLKNKREDSNFELAISPLILNWLVIKRSQVMALFFSFGLLLSLLAMVATKDIAFAWSTTLDISPETFHSMLGSISFAWKDIFPWAVPSLELIQNSQYYRLGDGLSSSMIENASLLGEWWKFLFVATIFYAIFLRFIVFLFSSYFLKKAIVKSFMLIDGAQKLLNDMNEAIVSTSSIDKERRFVSKNIEYAQTISTLNSSYDFILAWAINRDKIVLINDSVNVMSQNIFEVGGSNSFEKDNSIVNRTKGEVLLYVKAWEPPTMDFIDFVEMLIPNVDKIIVMPIGTSDDFTAREKDLNVWARKLFSLKNNKVWLKEEGYKDE
ncbi:hypothetical protein MNB_SV-5-596 [hydrothermal vent metagenome]|uniref:DUF2868 domain-containing protein n=1 Tax=hydrothermal vent metagenome TaxID=652676 RepID=A0A1W1EC70_9ZZZZ